MKTCFKCGEVKPLAEFYRHPRMGDGHLGKCKECTKRDSRANRAAKVERYREYDRERYQKWSRKVQVYRYSRRQAARHPERKAARVAVNNAVRDGRLTRRPCEVCGATERVEAHHHDYSKPLEVRWLCDTHHHLEHRRAA